MTVKRLFLVLLTVLAAVLIGSDLWASWNKPQFQSRLELYEADLRLHLSQWQGEGSDQLRQVLQQQNPVQEALEQYTEVRQQANTSLSKTKSDLARLRPRLEGQDSQSPERIALDRQTELDTLTQALSKQVTVIEELDLRIGILQVQQNQVAAALKTWQSLPDQANERGQTAAVLVSLWQEPPRPLATAEFRLKQGLDGWFRYQALTRLYRLQNNQTALKVLEAAEQVTAQQALIKLGITSTVSLGSVLMGLGLTLFLVVQYLLKGKDSLLANIPSIRWSVPWGGETIWQVLIVGFFFVGQFVLPLLLGVLQGLFGWESSTLSERSRALLILLSYLGLAGGGLAVLYVSIRAYLPLPQDWFHLDWDQQWWRWGLGGYFVAFPLVVGVTLVNQEIWHGQGGSNPILPIALQNQDPGALVLIFVTAAIAAPFYEETLFRGFLLPSLTKYLPTWGAIGVSSFIFAVVHLSLSEILPLMALGIVLGVVYTRTRNLLVSMLLHSLWNSGTLITLFLLGQP
jgi:membrane protease YdiL (CAAX protease family)